MVICAAGAVHGSVSPAARLYPKFPIILTLQDSPDTNFLIFSTVQLNPRTTDTETYDLMRYIY